MDVVKNLKDYSFTTEQRIFASFLRENVNSYSCSERITNPDFLVHYCAPENDFTIYATGVADPRLLLRRAS
ncbi:MAG: hypothetical protein PHC64_00950 [Candidatus Gastranaerophilales bacterium]|nr:hypothetical protein [Candidatus Gastranaerophilales bacterium]